MGGVVVLPPPKDLFRDRSPRPNILINSPMKYRRNPNYSSHPYPNPNPNPNSKSNVGRSSRRRRSPARLQKSTASEEPAVNPPSKNNLVMGQVKILKRGETLTNVFTPKKASADTKDDEKTRKASDDIKRLGDDLVVLSSTDRLGPEPEMVPMQIRIGNLYAGSAFITSPPPSSLPLPVFFTKRKGDATSDLRRILGLE